MTDVALIINGERRDAPSTFGVVNPATGQKIQIAASKAPKFSAGAKLKAAVKG